MTAHRSLNLSLLLAAFCALMAGCGLTPVERASEPQPVVPQTAVDPLATHLFKISDDDDVVGELQVTRAIKDDTLSDIARRFNLGYEELVRANPGVDPWVLAEGKEVILPTQFVLPNAPREGLVVNLAALRVYYFPKRKPGELQTVITHPIGIGKVGWVTPEGVTKVTAKKKNPVWVPPVSVRKEHAEHGDPLPKIVPPGDDNPLGAYAMTLGWPGYLIHGTNKPYGVGMRSSHGCMRFYPEDIALLFDEIAIGTKVQVVNQRLVSGWHNGSVYVQVMPPTEEEQMAQQAAQQPTQKIVSTNDKQTRPTVPTSILNSTNVARLAQQAQQHTVNVDQVMVDQLVQEQTGVAMPVTNGMSEVQLLAGARRVDNRVPAGATWDGNKSLLVTAEEFDAMRNGVILPKKEEQKPEAKKINTKSVTDAKKVKAST